MTTQNVFLFCWSFLGISIDTNETAEHRRMRVANKIRTNVSRTLTQKIKRRFDKPYFVRERERERQNSKQETTTNEWHLIRNVNSIHNDNDNKNDDEIHSVDSCWCHNGIGFCLDEFWHLLLYIRRFIRYDWDDATDGTHTKDTIETIVHWHIDMHAQCTLTDCMQFFIPLKYNSFQFSDCSYDMVHFGHANSLRQAKALGKRVFPPIFLCRVFKYRNTQLSAFNCVALCTRRCQMNNP